MTTVEQSKIDTFRAKIEQRKACEKRALNTCLQLIEEDKVDNDTLINAAVLIDQERYRGVNEDRGLRQICGYPLCSTALPKDAPSNQYFINVKVNKVIDTTERRFFCSTFCYKASKYFERQIPTSPVWAREQLQKTPGTFKIDLLTPETLKSGEQNDNSTIISQSNYMRTMPKVPHHRQSSSSSSSDEDDFEKLQLARDEYYKSRAALPRKPTLMETKLQQISLPDCIRTDNNTIDFVITCLYEWLTDKTKDYLRINNTATESPTPIDPKRYEQLVKKIEADDLMSFEEPRGEKTIPTMDEVRRTAAEKQYELKVKEFLCGKTVTPKEETSASSAINLPPVDAYSQQSIRLSIVSEKIMTCFKQMFSEEAGQTIARDLRVALSELLLTLSFSNENITLKPNEWTIITLFLAHLLIERLPTLLPYFTQSKIVRSLLTTLNLSSDMIVQTVKYLLEHPLADQPLTSSSTNFEDID